MDVENTPSINYGEGLPGAQELPHIEQTWLEGLADVCVLCTTGLMIV